MNELTRRVVVSALLAAAGAAHAAAGTEGLAVRLSAPEPLLRGDVDVVVNLSVTNTTGQPISVLRWELPGARHENAAFQITRDGQPVAYTGALVKRAAPTAADYVRIEPGATLNYSVDLSSGYDLSRDGTYAVQYSSRGAREGGAIRSDALYLWLQSRTARNFSVPAPAVNTGGTSVITFTGNCSTTQQSQITQAVADALTYSTGAVNYFASTRFATQRFVKWFGPGTRSSWTTVRTHFGAIQDAFATKPLTMDCSCNQAGVYAYVFPSQPYKIFLCPVFWQAPALGTDSKAGTLVHEMSHFTVVAGTQDYAYGQSAAAALAINNPQQAINNADSHEYFAENTPTLP